MAGKNHILRDEAVKMDYPETIEFLFKSLPMYQRNGKAAYKANLDNSLKLDAHLSHPHLSFPSIHVAGTNGKGSVSHMLASVLQASGYKTALYTSPHLLDFRERIRINGVPIPELEVCGFINQNRGIIKEMIPSFFEMTVAMAFEYFARQKVDIGVIETGLGGRLDSTNIITPQLSIITNISLDHTEFLGPDIRSIAREKAGIIKERVPLVIGHPDRETESIFLEVASEKDAPVTLAYNRYATSFRTFNQEGWSVMRILNKESGNQKTVTCDLTGDYQQENVITTLASLEQLRKLGWVIPDAAIEKGMSSVAANTGIMGRWQIIGSNPRTVCDTAHNYAGIESVMKQVCQVPWKKLHMVWGMVSDKDLTSILPLLPSGAQYYFTRSGVPRSMDAEHLYKAARKVGLNGEIFPTVGTAYKAALKNADPRDMIFTGGSTFVVADLLRYLGY